MLLHRFCRWGKVRFAFTEMQTKEGFNVLSL